MSEFRVCRRQTAVCALALASVVFASVAYAQSTGSSTSGSSNSSPSNSSPSISATASEVKDWTREKWREMRHEWQKDKAKWDACHQQATDQKLSGRASWSFIYTCMTAS
jgi:hypothetical protein